MYICRHFPREHTMEMEGVCRVYVAVSNNSICTKQKLGGVCTQFKRLGQYNLLSSQVLLMFDLFCNQGHQC